LPYDVLYFRINIEPYRSDRFTNWTVGPAGSIFGGSWWSWIGIHPPVQRTMRISLEAPSAMVASTSTEESSVVVKATVRNLDGTPREGATVEIVRFTPQGNLSYGPQKGETVTGETDINGDFIATYIAPIMDETANETVRITLTATARFEDEVTEQVKVDIVVYPPGVPFLSILPRWTAGDVVKTKDSLPLKVEVRDQFGVLVEGAIVTVTSETGGPTVSPANGTTAGGEVNFLVTAPNTVLESEEEFSFVIQATGGGVDSDEYTILLTVIKPKTGDGDGDMTFMLIAAVAVIAVVAVLASILAVRKRPRRRRRT
ncbi:MAG: hypothetical protein ACE5IO_10415, partial [Thermoplasmata archaeon]